MHPVREISTGWSATRPSTCRKYGRPSMSVGAPEDRRRGRSLQGKRRRSVRDVLDLHDQVGGVEREPSEHRMGGSPPEPVLAQPGDRAVAEDRAVLVAPGRVQHLSGRHRGRAPRDDAIDEPDRVAAGHGVLDERRHVEEGRGVSNGGVLGLAARAVHVDGVVPGPFAVVQARAPGERAIVQRGRNGHAPRIIAGTGRPGEDDARRRPSDVR